MAMSKFSEPATGKCEKCGDQLLSIPGRYPGEPRRIICPICTVNELEELRMVAKRRVRISTPESLDE